MLLDWGTHEGLDSLVKVIGPLKFHVPIAQMGDALHILFIRILSPYHPYRLIYIKYY